MDAVTAKKYVLAVEVRTFEHYSRMRPRVTIRGFWQQSQSKNILERMGYVSYMPADRRFFNAELKTKNQLQLDDGTVCLNPFYYVRDHGAHTA